MGEVTPDGTTAEPIISIAHEKNKAPQTRDREQVKVIFPVQLTTTTRTDNHTRLIVNTQLIYVLKGMSEIYI